VHPPKFFLVWPVLQRPGISAAAVALNKNITPKTFRAAGDDFPRVIIVLLLDTNLAADTFGV
jgi:hypothetical protein